jgi:hypothetical protein
MNQASLAIPAETPQPADRTGFDIGWDHAHYGCVPPAQGLNAESPVCQGWMAGKAVFGRRTLPSRHSTRWWLALRLQAWTEGAAFDEQLVTPNYLAQLQVNRCPVLRCSLGSVAGADTAAVIVRINPAAGYAAGNLVMLSHGAAQARIQVSTQEACRRARQAELMGEPVAGLDAAAWWRVAGLSAFAQAMPFAEVARLPMALMAPNRVRVLNAAQGLQALVTQWFLSPGWSQRCQTLARLLPEHTLRLDFNLFVGAMAPRVLEACAEPAARRLALEDAWLMERVQRRWQHLVLSLGETGVQRLLERVAQTPAAGVQVRQLSWAEATESWGLPASAARPVRSLPRSGVIQRVRALRPELAAARQARPGTSRPPAVPATHA